MSFTEDPDTWKSGSFREAMTVKIESYLEISNEFGMAGHLASMFEKQIFIKVKSKTEYLTCIAKLIVGLKSRQCKSAEEIATSLNNLTV